MILFSISFYPLKPPLYFRYAEEVSRYTITEKNPLIHTRCHVKETVIAMSTNADVPSQTMTGALNFWNCSHSGTLLMAAAVAKPPTAQGKRWRVELS